MSCRVMGLSVETAFLQRIYQDARHAEIKTLVGEFLPTKKNRPVEDFYSQHGFSLIDKAEGHQLCGLDVTFAIIEKPDWITTTGVPRHDG